MSYVCLRGLKSKVGENKYVERKPGDPVPEVEKYWPNPSIWVKRGYIKWVGEGSPPADGVDRSKLTTTRAATPAEIAERSEKIRQGTLAPSGFETTPASPRDLLGPEDGTDEFGSPQVSPVVGSIPASTELEGLLAMKKAELVDIAKSMDLPTRNRGKEDLAQAILDARQSDA